MASTYLTRTLTNSNQRTFTFSCWVKRSGLSSTQYLLGVGGGGAYASALYFMSSDEIEVWNYFNNSYAGRYRTSAKYRDVNAWLHIVMAIDTTQSTDTDRFKLYVNGELITNYAVRNNTAQNQTWEFNSGSVHEIGRNASNPFDGSMSHVHFCDGQQLAPTVFGETDSTTGEWKIKADASFTPGTNGFTILKDGNTITDQSANSNDFTVGAGTLTKTEDCPSNVFATLNPLLDVNNGMILSKGNTTAKGWDSGNHRFAGANICVSSGKYYYEVKVTKAGSSPYCGIIDAQSTIRRNGVYFVAAASGVNDSGYAVNMSGDIYHNNSSTYATSIGSISTGDILGFAVDLDSAQRTCTIYKNGTSMRTFNIAAPSSGFYMLGCCSAYNEINAQADFNFGNGYFGTTAVSSAGTNASNLGIFEYDVPSGYTALCTKGLNE